MSTIKYDLMFYLQKSSAAGAWVQGLAEYLPPPRIYRPTYSYFLFMYIKFMFSKKATKNYKIFAVDLTLTK